MKVTIVPVTPFQQNCSVLVCEQSNRAAVVDPGGELDNILAVVEQENAQLEKIFVTHAHIDHAGGVAELAERFSLPIEGPHKEDQFWIDMLEEQAKMFDFPDSRAFTPDRWLEQGDSISFGNIRLEVHHCPGHTPGHVIFHQPETQLAIVGDVLFQGSIGRTDFPRGDHETLINSMK